MELGLLIANKAATAIRTQAFIQGLDLKLVKLGGFFVKTYAVEVTGPVKKVEEFHHWLRDLALLNGGE